MLLRSSSTPILGSLLPSITESPNNPRQSELHGTATKHPPPSIHHCSNKLSCISNGGSQNFTKSLLSSPSVTETKGRTPQNGFRRVQSEGHLQELANESYNIDEFSISSQFNKKFARKPNISSLEPIPSFSLHKLGTASENYDDSDEEEEDKEPEEGENVNFFKVENMISEEWTKNVNEYGNLGFEGEGKLYLATGLGVSGITFVDGNGSGGHNGGGSYCSISFNRDGGGGDNCGYGIEENYKKMMEENPGNPLFLRNYAQFLYQTKGDLTGADEYYSRAILADPEDGDILSQYAKLIWELHHDKERATNYFERAVQASSEDSHIHAAYASFLWDIEDDEDDEEENATNNSRCGLPQFNYGIMASATA